MVKMISSEWRREERENLIERIHIEIVTLRQQVLDRQQQRCPYDEEHETENYIKRVFLQGVIGMVMYMPPEFLEAKRAQFSEFLTATSGVPTGGFIGLMK